MAMIKRVVKNLSLFGFFLMVRPVPVARLLEKLGLMAGPTHRLFRPPVKHRDTSIPSHSVEEGGTVVGGPFDGLRYPTMRSFGSVLEGKLYGVYEAELAPEIERLLQRHDYRQVIDVGAAEGYYAVGLAKRLPGAEILAFDTSPHARAMLGEIAKHNQLGGSRLRIGQFCSPVTLSRLDWPGRALLVCDCEGYERILFSHSEVADHLGAADLIVELHAGEGHDIRGQLESAFAASHDIRFVPCKTPIEKFRDYADRLPEGLKPWEVYRILDEQRSQSFGWLILESKKDV